MEKGRGQRGGGEEGKNEGGRLLSKKIPRSSRPQFRGQKPKSISDLTKKGLRGTGAGNKRSSMAHHPKLLMRNTDEN